MSACETIKAAYAAFGRNDPSVLFGAMDPSIAWRVGCRQGNRATMSLMRLPGITRRIIRARTPRRHEG